ncbi:hypothetical protein PoB_006656700 [Plakobranchus ocellatus]|uniref:Uncharacterized protein n=1 Tax=Plakobranchus ocellatus TaxID=259542 RepID=A0AAV4D7E0_9GAST|nr:hypothetical protein PoB_006656700 [Plakobranchus ocellatus]
MKSSFLHPNSKKDIRYLYYYNDASLHSVRHEEFLGISGAGNKEEKQMDEEEKECEEEKEEEKEYGEGGEGGEGRGYSFK